jgi:hypothetical protein
MCVARVWGCSREGDEPTLELAAGVTAGMTGLPGQSLLEDATLEDFALPPEMMAAADERPITMPFSGMGVRLGGRVWGRVQGGGGHF